LDYLPIDKRGAD
jgi:DNA replication protein DnaC